MKRKIIGLICLLALICTAFAWVIPSYAEEANNVIIKKSDFPLRLWYTSEAPKINEHSGYREFNAAGNEDDGWQQYSLPIGNGYFGANVFGRTDLERIQISEKTLANKRMEIDGKTYGGLNNFSETFIDFGHKSVSDYERYLDLETAISGVSYTSGGVKYSREYFTSYPDKALVIKLDSDTDGALSFTLRPTIPYEQSYMVKEGDRMGKSGTVTSSVKSGVGYIELAGKLEYYDVDFLGIYKVYTDGGTVTATNGTNAEGKTDDGTIAVKGANSAYIIFTCGTDYELSSKMFTTSDTEKPTFETDIEDTRAKVEAEMNAIEAKIAGMSFNDAYNTLKNAHLEDYTELFGRVTMDLGCNIADSKIPTSELLKSYKNGYKSTYLEMLMFQYGRYTLIASSRSGALPAHLQGVWNTYNTAPWGSGYWHNINVQMNYWPAFSTNLAETFDAYVDFNKAFLAEAEAKADSEIEKNNPDVYGEDGGNGWIIGMSSFPYRLSLDASIGNLGFTTQMFWDYYQYTKDETVLEKTVYPILLSAARYITKCVELDENGNYLVPNCDSPEVFHNGVWYYTDGTTYAQTFAYLNNYHVLELAKELGIDLTNLSGLVDQGKLSADDCAILTTILEQIDKYDPIHVGLSGQIKEFREEDFYSSIGDDPNHRHVAQLSGLYPGNTINSSTPAWLDAAEVTLYGRRLSTAVGWTYAYKAGLYARVKDAEAARDQIDDLLSKDTFVNLYTRGWDIYQADATYGTTAAMAEMLLQCNSGYIELLPAIPANWANGSYTGLCAEGNFEISAAWESGIAKTFNITSKSGGTASLYYPSITSARVVDSEGNTVSYTVDADNLISFETEVGKTYIIYGFSKATAPDAPNGLVATKEETGAVQLNWAATDTANSYNVYVAVDNASTYTLVGSTSETSFLYTPGEGETDLRTTYAVTAVNGGESKRALTYTYSDEVLETPYGTVTTARVEGETFIMFAKALGESEYQFLGTGNQFVVEGLDKARLNLKQGADYYQGGTIVIYLLTDCISTGTASGAGWNAAPQIDGTVIVDLGGHTLTSNAKRLVGFEAKAENNGYDCVTNFEFKNGTIKTSNPIVEILGDSSDVYTGTKVCNISFNGVTFATGNVSTGFTLFNARGGYSLTQRAELNLGFTDCAMSFATLNNMTLLNDTTVAGAVACNVSVNGGTLQAKSFDNFIYTKGFASEDSIIFKKGVKTARTEFTVGYTSTAPTLTFNTDDGVKHLASAGVDNGTAEASRRTTYRLSSIKTPYGYVPENQKDATFALFYNGLHINSFNVYYNAEVRVKELLYPSDNGIYAGESLTLYMRKDYEKTSAPYGNFAQQDGTFVLDLGGNTMTLTGNGLFDVVGKAVNNTLKTTSAIVKDGTIITDNSSIMILNSKGTSGNFGYDGTKPFGFTYENVTFDKKASASEYVPLMGVSRFDETETKNMHVAAVFNNCTFKSSDAMLFDLSISNYIDADITVNGGKIIANALGEPTVLKASDESDTLTFGKLENGNYTSFTFPYGTEAPTVTFNAGNLHFIKVSETESTVTYALGEIPFAGFDFTPKSSITLYTDFIYNVYLPKTSALESLKLNGEEIAIDSLSSFKLDDGKDYYRITVDLNSYDALRDINIEVVISDGENSYKGSFTFGMLKYANSVVDGDYSVIEKYLVKDMLSYVRSAYSFWNKESDKLGVIETLLGDNYDEKPENAPTTLNTEAWTPSGSGFSYVTFYLGEAPSYRFYYESDAAPQYTFEVGEREIVAKYGCDSRGNYLEIKVYAYEILLGITFTDGIRSFEYNIYSYYAQAENTVKPLVERLIKYCERAMDYKNSFLIKINFVDESGNKLAGSYSYRHKAGEEINLLSPSVEGYYTRDVYLTKTVTENAIYNVVYKKIPTNIDENRVNEILSNVVCWGDSITAGACKSVVAPAEQYGIDLVALGSAKEGASYVTVLRNLISKRVYSKISVRGCGVGGESTSTIASRADTETYYLYLDGEVTVSDATVEIPLTHYSSGGRVGILRQGDTAEINPVTILGKDKNGNDISVTGAISVALTSDAPTGTDIRTCDAKYLKYSFTRDDGKTDAISFISGARVITKASYLYDGRTCIIFMGENGGYSDISELIKQQEEMLEACGNPEFYLIISTTSGSYESRSEIREALSARWGDRYINMGDKINSRDAYEFVGYSESAIASVESNIAEGTVSSLLINDSCHPNAVGYAYVGNVIFKHLLKIGAFDALFDYYDELN